MTKFHSSSHAVASLDTSQFFFFFKDLHGISCFCCITKILGLSQGSVPKLLPRGNINIITLAGLWVPWKPVQIINIKWFECLKYINSNLVSCAFLNEVVYFYACILSCIEKVNHINEDISRNPFIVVSFFLVFLLVSGHFSFIVF